MKLYFDTEHNTIVPVEQIMQEYIADHRIGESIYDRIQNSLVWNGGTLVELPGDFVPVDTEKKSTSKSTPLDGDDNQLWVWDTCLDQCVCVNAEEGIPHWWQMDLTDLEHAIDRLKATLEYHRRIESLQEITKRIRNYVATFGSFWLENIVDADGRVSFRDIADSIGYEISHLERSVDE